MGGDHLTGSTEVTDFYPFTGVSPELFLQLDNGSQAHLLAAVAEATRDRHQPAAKAVLECCQGWNQEFRLLSRYVVPAGQTDSVASLEAALEAARQRVSLDD